LFQCVSFSLAQFKPASPKHHDASLAFQIDTTIFRGRSRPGDNGGVHRTKDKCEWIQVSGISRDGRRDVFPAAFAADYKVGDLIWWAVKHEIHNGE